MANNNKIRFLLLVLSVFTAIQFHSFYSPAQALVRSDSFTNAPGNGGGG